jgi:hypothetical protein
MPLRIDEYSSPVSFGGGLRVASYDAAGALRLEGHLPGDRDVKRAGAREDAPATGATARFAGTAARIRHTEGTPTLCARAVALARVATGANWDAIVACILR